MASSVVNDISTCEGRCSEEELKEIDGTEVSGTLSERDIEAGTEAENQRPKLDARISSTIWSALPDYLVEKIIARLPFKSLFRASSLSRAWKLRFRCKDFQEEVRTSSTSWKSYSPLFVPLFMTANQNLLGYERTSMQWHILPALSYLPPIRGYDWCLRATDGSLLCWTTGTIEEGYDFLALRGSDEVLVTNPLTKSWKILPPRPKAEQPREVVYVVTQGREAYQVLFASIDSEVPRSIHVQIFDSTKGSWTVEKCHELMPPYGYFIGSAIVNGFLHVLVLRLGSLSPHMRDRFSLFSLDLKDRLWKEARRVQQAFEDEQKPTKQMCFYGGGEHHGWFQLFSFGKNLMFLVLHKEREIKVSGIGALFDRRLNTDITLSIFSLDVESGWAVELSRAPKETMICLFLDTVACRGDFIYIEGRFLSRSSMNNGVLSECVKSMCYNVATKEWSWNDSDPDHVRTHICSDHVPARFFREGECRTLAAYEPGSNPFLEV